MIEAIGLPDAFRAAVDVVAFTGRVVYVGYAKEPANREAKLFVQEELDIMGSRSALPDVFRAVMTMFEERRFPVDPTVTAIVGLEDTPRMLREWSASPRALQRSWWTSDDEDAKDLTLYRYSH